MRRNPNKGNKGTNQTKFIIIYNANSSFIRRP
jgi:hypothetical protein